MSEPLTLYKLIILYMLEKVDFPLTNAQISGFVLDKGYTNYFHLQQAISELIDSNLIEAKTIRNSSYFQITEQGEQTLSYFGDQISDGIKADISAFLSGKHYTDAGRTVCHCRLLQGRRRGLAGTLPFEKKRLPNGRLNHCRPHGRSRFCRMSQLEREKPGYLRKSHRASAVTVKQRLPHEVHTKNLYPFLLAISWGSLVLLGQSSNNSFV